MKYILGLAMLFYTANAHAYWCVYRTSTSEFYEASGAIPDLTRWGVGMSSKMIQGDIPGGDPAFYQVTTTSITMKAAAEIQRIKDNRALDINRATVLRAFNGDLDAALSSTTGHSEYYDYFLDLRNKRLAEAAAILNGG